MSALSQLGASALDPELAQPCPDRLPVLLGPSANHLVLFSGHHDDRQHFASPILRLFWRSSHARHVDREIRHAANISNHADFVYMEKKNATRLTIADLVHISKVMTLTATEFVGALGDTLEDWCLISRDRVVIAGGKAQFVRDGEVLFNCFLSHNMAVAVFRARCA